MDPTDVDVRMEQEPFTINFCLKLPLSVDDIKNNRVLEDLGRKHHFGKATSVLNFLGELK